MCQTVSILKKNNSGSLTYCNKCKCFKLSYTNLAFEFTDKQLNKFIDYINDVPVDFWTSCDVENCCRRSIPIHTGQQNLTLMFNRAEFNELKELVGLKDIKKEYLSILDIQTELSLN